MWHVDRWERLEEIAEAVDKGETISFLVGNRMIECEIKSIGLGQSSRPPVHMLTPE
jgi:hypothetical protein